MATGVLLVMAAFSLATLLTDPRFVASAGWDFALYRDAAARWLHGAGFYSPEQLAGPYLNLTGVMYPPPTLLLFLPFTELPTVLWWAVPIGIVAWRVWTLRPSPWTWAGIAACLAWPLTVEMIYNGKPALWIVAALALATRWPWVSVFVLAKASLFPFALVGVRNRSWWLALGTCAVVSALFLPMWPDWIAAVLNARGEFSGPLYSLRDVPALCIPLIAWLGSSRARHRVSVIAT